MGNYKIMSKHSLRETFRLANKKYYKKTIRNYFNTFNKPQMNEFFLIQKN